MKHLHAIGWILGITTALGGCATRPDVTREPAGKSEPASAEMHARAANVEESDGQTHEAQPLGVAADDGANHEAVDVRRSEAASVVTELGGRPDDGDTPASAAQAGPGVESSPSEPAPESARFGESEPEPEPEPEPPGTSLVSVPGANISVEEVEADGQRIKGLACRADDVPLFGMLAVVASIAEHKRALDRCAPRGGATAVTWEFRKGKARDVTVTHAAPSGKGACVAKVMRKVVAPFSARCGAVVLMGDAAGADRALAELSAAP